ncbi:flagellar hook-associated protein 2 [Kineothrix alysoides]|uniref:Flagellar hook-associated protein 2 n=1 Tax=Kineothrix alysoides TaxID=1469948 RepID=A0A4R1QYP8_9FIRM|nr:flagellar filament capping protein FliD [Kineothrix alysoides]TCL58088.1 flagellar hook-associated protein 2 [Kineothrix alysoides]
MAYNGAVLSNIHNNYLTAYAPNKNSRFDAHKKSELRNIYNSIVKLNKDAPLYKLDTSKEAKTFAVGIKEDARSLRSSIASLGGLDEEKILNKKAAYSSNEDMVVVSFIGEQTEAPDGQDVPSYNIEVNSLASGQFNIGVFLPDTKTKLSPDTYSFDISINDLNYEFQYNIKENETNREVQRRLSRLITNADIGLRADVIEDGRGNSSLRLSSVSEGLKDADASIFTVSDDHTSKNSGSVSYFGLDYLARPASNAEFLLNGMTRTSTSNTFTVDGLYEVTLKGISSMEGQAATIGLKTDVESLTENVNALLKSYNSFIADMSGYTDNFSGSRRLLGEMKGITDRYQSSFDVIGLKVQDNGTINIDKDELASAVLSSYAKEDFSSIKNFANSLIRKTDQISLNPMNYANKTIVAYKNPGKNYATPYITSAYSGMLFNYYC